MEQRLTILTPTYNRADCLKKAFSSLLKQTNKHFVWIIIDDGSNDKTKQVVDEFYSKADFDIIYLYKENGGKHTALNLGVEITTTEFLLVLDSDDILTEDAAESIISAWKEYGNNRKIGMITFLKGYISGNVIGEKFPKDVLCCSHVKCRDKMNIKGDKAETIRTECMKKYPFPVVENEKFMSEAVVWNKIGPTCDNVYINKIVYLAEYRTDGLTHSGRKLLITNPRGGMLCANVSTNKPFSLKKRMKSALLHGTYGLFAHMTLKEIVCDSNAPLLSFMVFPLSSLIYMYWGKKYQ